MDALLGYAQIIVPILAVIFAWRYIVLLTRRTSLAELLDGACGFELIDNTK